MLISSLLLLPILGIFLISGSISYDTLPASLSTKSTFFSNYHYKIVALVISIANLIISLVIYILFDFSCNQFQFVQEHYDMSFFDIYLGVDGISVYFVLLTTIIMPIAILSN